MLGTVGAKGYWSEGVYENTWVKDDGVWKLKDLRYFPTFISDYDSGWGKDAQPVPTASTDLPPDRPPTSVYAIYPKAHIPPYHYDNPVSGLAPRYPEARGRPTDAAIKAIRAPVDAGKAARGSRAQQKDVDALVAQTEQQVGRVKDFYEIDNLISGYGYYLDKNLWTDLANLFSEHGTIELAQRGVYIGRERVRAALFNVFGKEGPQENRLGNHIQWQAVIHVAPDGQEREGAFTDDAAARVRAAAVDGRVALRERVREGERRLEVQRRPHLQHLGRELRGRLGEADGTRRRSGPEQDVSARHAAVVRVPNVPDRL